MRLNCKTLLAGAALSLVLGCGGNGGKDPASPASSDTSASSGSEPDLAAAAEGTPTDSSSKFDILATEVRRSGPDGSVEEGAMVEAAPYASALEGAVDEIEACAGGTVDPTLMVNITPTGSVGKVEMVETAPACLPGIIQKLSFPSRPHPVALFVVVTR